MALDAASARPVPARLCGVSLGLKSLGFCRWAHPHSRSAPQSSEQARSPRRVHTRTTLPAAARDTARPHAPLAPSFRCAGTLLCWAWAPSHRCAGCGPKSRPQGAPRPHRSRRAPGRARRRASPSASTPASAPGTVRAHSSPPCRTRQEGWCSAAPRGTTPRQRTRQAPLLPAPKHTRPPRLPAQSVPRGRCCSLAPRSAVPRRRRERGPPHAGRSRRRRRARRALCRPVRAASTFSSSPCTAS